MPACCLTPDPDAGSPLVAPATYWTASRARKAAICNGCGAKHGISRYFIPNSLWGLSVRPACDIHDWMYFQGISPADREYADLTFLRNLLSLVEQGHGPLAKALRLPRRLRALSYYGAVRDFGAAAFRTDKGADAAHMLEK
jgi:hypothetical protein